METESTEVPIIKRVSPDTTEVLRCRIILPEAPTSGHIPQDQEGGTMDGSQEPGVRLDPAQILNAKPGTGVKVKPKNNLAGAQVPEGNPALAISNS
jgi:hypothetical protein